MYTLQKNQQSFQSYILQTDLEKKNFILSHLASKTDALGAQIGLEPSRGLDIYYNGYRYRLLEILEQDYPKLKMAMQNKIKKSEQNEQSEQSEQTEPAEQRDIFFYQLLQAYIEDSPSIYYSVGEFGNQLSEYIKNQKQNQNQNQKQSQNSSQNIHGQNNQGDIQFFSELANFECQLMATLVTIDAPRLSIENLKNIPENKWSDMILLLHPSCRILKLHCNVPQVWNALENNKPCPPWTREKTPQSWLLYASNLQSCFRSLNQEEAHFLELICEQKSFGEICEQLCHDMAEEKIPEFTMGCLQSWFRAGLISEVVLNN